MRNPDVAGLHNENDLNMLIRQLAHSITLQRRAILTFRLSGSEQEVWCCGCGGVEAEGLHVVYVTTNRMKYLTVPQMRSTSASMP